MSTKQPPCPSRHIRPVLILLVSIGGLCLLLVLLAAGAWLNSRHQLNAELARIRAAGEPASVEEFEAFYQDPPAGQDTTQLWLTALAPLNTPKFQSDANGFPFVDDGSTPIPLPPEPWPQLESSERLLLKYQRSLDEWLLSAAALDDRQLARLDAELSGTNYQQPPRAADDRNVPSSGAARLSQGGQ